MVDFGVMENTSPAPKVRTGYPSDVSDEGWAFAAPYLTLISTDAPQPRYPLREVFNALRYLVRMGVPWRYRPYDFPPWDMVYQQARRWMAANVFEEMALDLRQLLRKAQGKDARPTAAIFDSRTLQSTIESGERAGYNGDKKKNGSKTHTAVDTLGHLLALRVTPANEQDRAQVSALAKDVQGATGENIKLAYMDQGYTGEATAAAAEEGGIHLEVVKLEEAKKGFVLLPKRWVVERSFAWASRFRRLARDYERVADVLAGYHWVVFAILLLVRAQNGIHLWKTGP